MGLSTFFTLVLLLVDLNRDGERCEQECFGTFRTYEPGHAWTSYRDSWQWDAQNAIVAVAFVLAVVAFLYMLGGRLRRAVVLTGVSLLMSATWIAWVALSPPVAQGRTPTTAGEGLGPRPEVTFRSFRPPRRGSGNVMPPIPA